MTEQDIKDIFLVEINRIAPDIDPGDVADNDHLQEDLELDSMDFLNLVAALDERLGISIPEADYTKIETTAKAVRYLADRLRAKG